MTAKELAGAAGLGVVLVVGAVAGVASLKDDGSTAKTVQTITYARDDGKGATAWVEVSVDELGGQVEKVVASSPCRRRPAGVPVAKCSRVCVPQNPQGTGQPPAGPCDSGDDVVMQAGQWVDNGGCEQVACAVVLGQEKIK